MYAMAFDQVSILNPESLLLDAGSYAFLIVLAFLFAGSGTVIAMALPGNSLLFVSGFLLSTGFFEIRLLPGMTLMAVAVFFGNLFGYWTGLKIGPRIFTRKKSRFFNQNTVKQAEVFFQKYGARTVVITRFIPFIRQIAINMAGVGKMNIATFTTYSFIGAVSWIFTLTPLGYFLGQFEFVQKNIELVTMGLFVISSVMIIRELRKQAAKQKLD